MTRSVRCANPECPLRPEIVPDDSRLTAEKRAPCPVCGSKSRAVSVSAADTAAATDSASATVAHAGIAEAKAEAFDAQAQQTVTATIEASAEVHPKLRVSRLGLDITHEIIVRFSDLQPDPNGPCVIELLLASTGEVITSGVGDTAGDALAQLFNYMLPPDNNEYFDPSKPEPEDDGDEG